MNFKKTFKLYNIFAGTTITLMHIANRFVYHRSTLESHLSEKDGRYYNSKVGEIFYIKKGNGLPLLLIHDLNVCSSSYEWNKVINELSKNNTVYAIDLLGCGCSDKSNLTYTNYLYIQSIKDFIQDIIGEKTNIIATGQSASIALMSCVNTSCNYTAPTIDKIILVNPENLSVLCKSSKRYSKIYKNIICAPVIGTFIYNIVFNRYKIEHYFRTYYYYNESNITEKDVSAYLEASQKHKTQSKYLYANMISGNTNVNISDHLNKIENSIYIVKGNSNPENELNASQYQNLIPSIKIYGIENTKHLPQLEAPIKFIEIISEIIK